MIHPIGIGLNIIGHFSYDYVARSMFNWSNSMGIELERIMLR